MSRFIDSVIKDLIMLKEGEWVPDDSSIQDSIDMLIEAKEERIEFAKTHVKAALQAASEKVEADFEPMGWLAEQHMNSPFKPGEDYEIGISRSSILEAYPEENIK
jgi:enolase